MVDRGDVGAVGFDLGDGNEWQARVAQRVQQAVQRGLVDDRAVEVFVVPSRS